MKLRCSTLQNELAPLHEKVKVADSLQEEEKIHDSPTTLDAWVTKLEDALKLAEKRYQDAYDIVKEKTRQEDEHYKIILQEAETHADTLKSLKDEVVSLKQALYDSLLQTMQIMLGVCDQFVE